MVETSDFSRRDDYVLQIRDKLRKDNLKLWLEPYYSEEMGTSTDDLQKLGREFSTTLSIPYEECLSVLEELQRNALENLKQSHHFKESGLATLKIRLLPPHSTVINIEMSLFALGSTLKQMIRDKLETSSIPSANLSNKHLKLISAGKVLVDDTNLQNQGVRNGQQIMVLLVTGSADTELQQLARLRGDTDLLRQFHDRLQLEDQFGNAVNIPDAEKKSLIVAMGLHEKGRAAMKRDDYAHSLIFLLEAERCFNQCRNTDILTVVDNYALLNLDVAWCYLMLRSVVNLPEAYERLQRCERSFHATYGPNLERLVAVKGRTGTERALFMRLHLLQGITLYHRNLRQQAKILLERAQTELNGLRTDENSVVLLAELGYSVTEARLGLRATNGDVNAAALYINEQREKRKEGRKKAREEEQAKKEREKFGLCADGQQYVNSDLLQLLTGMGYRKKSAKKALAATNNVISDAIQYLSENQESGTTQGPSTSTSNSSNGPKFSDFARDLVPQLEAAGFDINTARSCFEKHAKEIFEALPPSASVICEKLVQLLREEEEKEKAFQQFTQDLSMVDDDYLNLTLEQEEQFLNHYLQLLSSSGSASSTSATTDQEQ